MAGGDIHRRKPIAPFRLRDASAGEGEEEIGAARIEQPLLSNGARGDEANHVAADDRFGAAFLRLRGILHLLADRHPMTKSDQALQVIVGAVDRDPAHGDVVALMLATLRQDDAERPARGLRVVEEELVEIAHAVKQEAIRVRGLDLHVLRHHRRHAGLERRDLVGGCLGFGKLWGLVEGLG